MGLAYANLRLFTYPYQSKELILIVTLPTFLTCQSFRNWLIILFGIKNPLGDIFFLYIFFELNL